MPSRFRPCWEGFYNRGTMRHLPRLGFVVMAAAVALAVPSESAAQWRMINFVDEFGDTVDSGAVSATVRSVRPMTFPYGDLTARIFVDCNRAWIRFSESPNLTGGSIQDGYTNFKVAVRVDGENIGRSTVRQQWGDKDLRFVDGSEAIAWLSSGSTFAIAVPWYGQSSAAFSWSLSGSSKMIRDSCD